MDDSIVGSIGYIDTTFEIDSDPERAIQIRQSIAWNTVWSSCHCRAIRSTYEPFLNSVVCKFTDVKRIRCIHYDRYWQGEPTVWHTWATSDTSYRDACGIPMIGDIFGCKEEHTLYYFWGNGWVMNAEWTVAIVSSQTNLLPRSLTGTDLCIPN